MTDSKENHEMAERIAASVREQLQRTDQSRRTFLRRSALGGSLLAIGGGAGLAAAQSDEDDGDGAGTGEPGATFDDRPGTDVDVLNYALTLEHLEDAFYQQGLERFDESDVAELDTLSAVDEGVQGDVYTLLQAAGEQEATHVEVLSRAVELLGGDPAAAASYDFGVETVEDFVALGAAIENLGVAAYAGAAPYVESPDLLSTALSIHSVEARHAALFNALTGQSPFPEAFDPVASQREVLAAASQFVVSGDGDPEDDGGEETTRGEGTGTETGTGTDTGTTTTAGDDAGTTTTTESG